MKNWKYFIERIIDEEEKMPKDFINSSKGVKGNIRFTGQIAFSLALIKSKFPYEALPLSMNYPYSGTVHHTEHPEKLVPFVIHHHHCIAEDGKLLGTPYSNINKRIDEINSFLIENKEYNISLENDNPLVIRNLSMQHDFWEIVERIKNLPLDSTNADLQYYLALSLHHTAGTSSKDEAIARYKMALENDFDKFMIYKDRGYLYYLSSDIDNAKKDLEKAFDLILLSAEQGFATAQYGIGNMIYFGEGVPQDEFKGVEWIELAANQGFIEAIYALGEFYFFTEGPLVKDYDKSFPMEDYE